MDSKPPITLTRSGRLCAAGSCALAVLLAAAPGAAAGPLTLEDRIAARRAVEEVQWRHRLWPAENEAAKPQLDEVLPVGTLRRWVEDDLAKSAALDALWGGGIDAPALQAEMDRMAASSKDPDRLREIFAALGEDAELVAETLARPALADRLLRGRYASDSRLHRRTREAALDALSRNGSARGLRSLAPRYSQTEYLLDGPGRRAGPPAQGAVRVAGGPEWDRLVARLAAALGREDDGSPLRPRPRERRDPARLFEELPLDAAGSLQESEDDFHATVLVAKGPGRVLLATARWPKRRFDDWWESQRDRFSAASPESPGAASSSLTLPPITASACANDTWSAVRAAWLPEERDYHTAVWTGSEMIVWGGSGILAGGLSTGGRYAPATDTWAPTSTGASCPSPRWGHTAVWTGSEMIVWGGADGSGQLPTGARYSPATDAWQPTSAAGAPSPRDGHTAVWTGARMIVWGGNDLLGFLGDGARYDPSADSWTPVAAGGAAPEARYLHTAVWTGTRMIVWGGYNDFATYMNTGGRYDPVNDSWAATSTAGQAPPPTAAHTAVWTGSVMVVWGGLQASGFVSTGASYDPSSNSWTAMNPAAPNLPSARERHTALWTGTRMIVWGGFGPAGYLSTGARYSPAGDSWSATSDDVNVPSRRAYHSAVWTGTEMVLWGGYFEDTAQHVLDNGARYNPLTDVWTPVVGWMDPRRSHTAVWTGSEMVVWGGEKLRPPAATVTLDTGGRYTPATDTWTPTPTGPTAPPKRSQHTAIWTGTELIVWGGIDAGYTNTGGRYSPATNAWSATSIGANVPSSRAYHTAVWTGGALIVWGGTSGSASLGTGGRYAPASDSWTTVAAGPQARYAHTAVWTGAEMIVWGGSYRPVAGGPTRLSTGSRYDPAADAWTPMTAGGSVPAARELHSAVWTGSEMIVWGGYSGTAYLGTGGRYTPSTGVWSATSLGAGAPSARAYHSAVWTGSEMIVWGGSWNDGTLHLLDAGGRYDPASDAWSPTSRGNGVPAARDTAPAVWTGEAMIVWGGRGASGSLANGARYCAISCGSPPPPGAPVLTATGGSTITLSWSPLAGATAYDVVKGGLKSLRQSAGDFTVATTGCLAEDASGPGVPDAAIPSSGDGYWYLLRGVSCGGPGSYDQGVPSQRGSRDAEIAASANACR